MLRRKATKEKAQIRLWAGSKLAVRHLLFPRRGRSKPTSFAAKEDVHPSACGACVSR
ncbi:hypothetical protein HOY80DRAFT_335275 [Tuber brumale]|nr:hypothetical protein HOY80DRAFT_335275 [Tuber brumale]